MVNSFIFAKLFIRNFTHIHYFICYTASLQETLQHEVRLVDSLYRLGVQSTDLLSTLSLKVHSDHRSFVVDMRTDHVVVSGGCCVSAMLCVCVIVHE